MLAAAISEAYLWWMMVGASAAVLLVWVFGGGALLWVGGRFLARLPKATFWRSVGTNLLAGICAGIASTLIMLVAGAAQADPVLVRLWGAVAGLLVAWWIISAMLQTSFGKAILAWLPTLAQAAVTAPLVMLVILPTLREVHNRAGTELTLVKIRSVETALAMYSAEANGYPTEDQGGLKVLVEKPADDDEWRGRSWGGPYLPEPPRQWLIDAWGNKLKYEVREEEIDGKTMLVPHVWSVGPDGRDGTDDDVRNRPD